jgi:hypothetical protein
MITDARVIELAHKFEQYPMSIEPTIRGPGILEFARALLAEASVPAQPVDSERQTKAAEDVLQERARQITAEGWTPEHDDGALSMAAAGYALEASDAILNAAHELDAPGEPHIEDTQPTGGPPPNVWPHGWQFKPAPPRRMLVKAGALILAEIERLDRAPGSEE